MTEAAAFPRMRWVALAWLGVWMPIWAHTCGLWNFVHLCDIAVTLTCIGLWSGSALLLSTQAVSSMVVNLLWVLDLSWRLVTGDFLFGGTAYMFDAKWSLGVRLLSTFHAVWPVLLVWALSRTGYDPRAFRWQAALASGVMLVSWFGDPVRNLNGAFRDPIFGRSWGPPAVHLAVVTAVLIAAFYWPTHRLLLRALPGRHLV